MAAQVEFHTGLDDATSFACRLLRKAVRQGVRVSVIGSPQALDELDRRLWTFDERGFVAHARVAQAPRRVLERSPVWLVDGELPDGAPGVVVNLGRDLDAPPAAAERLIEVLSDDPDEALRGRERWRAYKALGLEPVHHAVRRAEGA